jgi:hypothetical protein
MLGLDQHPGAEANLVTVAKQTYFESIRKITTSA